MLLEDLSNDKSSPVPLSRPVEGISGLCVFIVFMLDFLDVIAVAVVVVVVNIVFVLEGGRDASSDPLGAGILKDISELKKGYPSIRRYGRSGTYDDEEGRS